MTVKINAPLSEPDARTLKVGDRALISGIIYTARDAAHKRLAAMLENGEELPIELEGGIIYYAGPCPARPGEVIGSVGPTTSGRMDFYTPALLDLGLRGMIGKGLRSGAVIDSIVKNGAVYFAAVGGAGALIAQTVKEAETAAFPELGAEAVYRLRVEDFPVTVAIDSRGNNLYTAGRDEYGQKEAR